MRCCKAPKRRSTLPRSTCTPPGALRPRPRHSSGKRPRSAAIVAKLNKAVNEVLQSPEAQEHFAQINLHAAGGTPAEAAAFIRKETEVWGAVIKDANVEAH